MTFGLALGGGGARGISHTHVLRALDDLGVKPSIIAGSSIGGLVGAGYASGMSGLEIQEFFSETFSNRTKVFAKLWKLAPRPSNLFNRSSSSVFGQMDIERVLDVFLPTAMCNDFNELVIPLLITATDYYGNQLKTITKGNLRQAIAASAAIPVVFTPVKIDDCILIDGGIANPLPFDLLMDKAQKVIAVDVVGLPKGDPEKFPSRMDIGFGTSQLLMQSITNLKLAANPPDIFLRPDVDDFRVLDFLKVDQILERSQPIYEETKRQMQKLMG